MCVGVKIVYAHATYVQRGITDVTPCHTYVFHPNHNHNQKKDTIRYNRIRSLTYPEALGPLVGGGAKAVHKEERRLLLPRPLPRLLRVAVHQVPGRLVARDGVAHQVAVEAPVAGLMVYSCWSGMVTIFGQVPGPGGAVFCFACARAPTRTHTTTYTHTHTHRHTAHARACVYVCILKYGNHQTGNTDRRLSTTHRNSRGSGTGGVWSRSRSAKTSCHSRRSTIWVCVCVCGCCVWIGLG